MIKIRLEQQDSATVTNLTLYTDDAPIPFRLSVPYWEGTTPFVYLAIHGLYHCVEFGFNKDTGSFLDVELISFQNDMIHPFPLSSDFDAMDDNYYQFYFDKENSIFDNNLMNSSLPMKIYRDCDSICLDFRAQENTKMFFYKLSETFRIGLDENSFLVSIWLIGLTSSEIAEILLG